MNSYVVQLGAPFCRLRLEHSSEFVCSAARSAVLRPDYLRSVLWLSD